jgi:hypothetical protein
MVDKLAYFREQRTNVCAKVIKVMRALNQTQAEISPDRYPVSMPLQLSRELSNTTIGETRLHAMESPGTPALLVVSVLK